MDRTNSKNGAYTTRGCSADVLRRDLMALRVVHGADSAIGSHCSNIVELIQMPNPPAFQLKRQMDGLQRAMRGIQ